MAERGATQFLEIDISTTDTPNWAALGGVQALTNTITTPSIDATTQDDFDTTRQQVVQSKLDGGGASGATWAVTGVLQYETTEHKAIYLKVHDLAQSGKHNKYRLTSVQVGMKTGVFVISSFEESSPYEGIISYSMTMESNGLIVFTPPTS